MTADTPIPDDCCAPDGLVSFVHVDADGGVVGVSTCSANAALHHARNVAGAVPLPLDQAAQLDGTLNWTYRNGLLKKTPPIAPPLALFQAAACARVDTAADEAARPWVTPGGRQALEYAAVEMETVAATDAPDPLDPALYPWLGAEQAAQLAAGNTVTLRQVATATAAQILASKRAVLAIRQIRRAAKLQIAKAATRAEIDAIMGALVWPAASD